MKLLSKQLLETSDDYFDIVAKGIVSGVLVGYLLVYGLRPSVPYPDFILDFFENKWMFLILVLIIYYAFLWDFTIGIFLSLCCLALVFDYVIFTNNETEKKEAINIDVNHNFPSFI